MQNHATHKHPLINHRVSFDRPRVILDSVTIVLPAASFMPLRALAMVGGLTSLSTSRKLYPEWASLHDLSLDGLSSFNVSRLVSWFGQVLASIPKLFPTIEFTFCRPRYVVTRYVD